MIAASRPSARICATRGVDLRDDAGSTVWRLNMKCSFSPGMRNG